MLLQEAGVDWLITGHLHVRRPVEKYRGMRLLKVSAAGGKRQYEDHWPDGDATHGFHVFTVGAETISCRFEPLTHESTAEGYGPHGHPSEAERDYSLAWEK